MHKHALECYLNAWLDKEIISACLVETTASAAMAVSLIALSVYARHNEWKGALQFPASCIVYIFFFFFCPHLLYEMCTVVLSSSVIHCVLTR